MFPQKLLDYNLGYIKTNTDVDRVVNCLQSDLRKLIEQCFPTKTVRVSSRDPMWTTPLVKVLLKERARLVARGVEGDYLILLTAWSGKIILEKRMVLASGKNELWAWWKKIEVLTHRKENGNLYIKKDFIHGLNTYIGRLCYDKHYIELTLIEISDNALVPQLTVPMVYSAL